MSEGTTDTEALVKVLEEPFQDYWKNLGRFLDEFAGVEKCLVGLLSHVVGIGDEKIAAAVFFGIRSDQGRNIINRVLDAKGDFEAKERLAGAFAQLGLIISVRNNILHWGANHVGEGDFQVTNAFFAHTDDVIREYTISADTIAAMTGDLFKIRIHLVNETMVAGDAPAFVHEIAAWALEGPWLYKSPPPPPRQRDSLGQKPKRKRQRGASQKSQD